MQTQTRMGLDECLHPNVRKGDWAPGRGTSDTAKYKFFIPLRSLSLNHPPFSSRRLCHNLLLKPVMSSSPDSASQAAADGNGDGHRASAMIRKPRRNGTGEHGESVSLS